MAKEAQRRFLESFLRTYEAGDFERMWEFYSPDCDYAVLDRFGLEKTTERYQKFMRDFLAAFPDLHHTIEKVVVDDDELWALYTVAGTHLGSLRGMEPTGRQVRYAIVGMYTVHDQLITRADFVSDDLRMMRQLGYA
ncbi:ester cyclase [Humibacter ginsenosidimutans]|uniref:Ester cyclase n=1 Tax=Humibacter ginsenosidimutans TaxID=2599293 RepID=A0A5B8M193_9MICO|nr:ester cyclase [Humibacter ginsenosidimutans]QDZ13704.1 ester cyclase [Humibacter ginsenosidimutans]